MQFFYIIFVATESKLQLLLETNEENLSFLIKVVRLLQLYGVEIKTQRTYCHTRCSCIVGWLAVGW